MNAAEIQGVRLDEVAKDSQGFVSGFDGKGGQRGFLTATRPADVHRRPVLRASHCVANRVFVEPAGTTEVIWVDSALGSSAEAKLSAWFGESGRQKLALRREVQTDRMPWYRLHWPRRRADMTQPKLVVPRRASESLFCLDLSASMVSSDCTYLTAPSDVDEPVEYLIRLMLLLNSAVVRDQFIAHGKRKGDIFEFYAGPLRRLIVPQYERGSIPQRELEVRVERAVAALRRGVLGYLDLK
ncbi:MAG: hypothetical protein R3E66_21795 [bacterium]